MVESGKNNALMRQICQALQPESTSLKLLLDRIRRNENVKNICDEEVPIDITNLMELKQQAPDVFNRIIMQKKLERRKKSLNGKFKKAAKANFTIKKMKQKVYALLSSRLL